MSDRTTSRTLLRLIELLAWVAGLAALAGLVVEVVRRSSQQPAAGLVGGLLVFHVVYVAASIRSFWTAPRIVIPITLLIGGTLWTLSLRSVERADLARGVISMIFIPLAMVYSIRLISSADIEAKGAASGRPSTVHLLLDKGKGLGNRMDRTG